MYEVQIITYFSAAHQLRNFRGSCEKLHGHNWKVEVTLQGERLNEAELLIDFKEVKDATNRVLDELDHSFLNELPHFKDKNPSSENIAAYIFGKLSDEFNNGVIRVSRVAAWESGFSNATYIG